jgi:hypothetical protein
MMNTENEEFDELRSLLTLKRHEVPPPGYFNTLSSKICARIEREEQAPVSTLFARLFANRIKPALAYSFVLSVCGLMAYAVNTFLHLEGQPTLARENSVPNQTVSLEPENDRQSSVFTTGASSEVANPPSLSPSLFIPLQVRPASFQINGN